MATIVLALVAGATTAAIAQTVRTRDRTAARTEAFSRAQAAANRIGADLENTLRDAELFDARVAITTGGSPGRESDGLLILANLTRPVRNRADQPEGREAEVAFRLEPSSDARGPGLTLWRRADPGLDDYLDAGGVATAMVDGVASLSVLAYDGGAWQETWDSDSQGFPYAVRVSVAASDSSGTATAVARRTVAFDRMPVPVVPLEEEEATDDEDAPASESGTSSGSSTGGTGGPTGGGQ